MAKNRIVFIVWLLLWLAAWARGVLSLIHISTQNPVGSAGTQLLPQAQLDRFMVRLEMGYPDFASQVNIRCV